MACKKSATRQRKMSKGERRAAHGPPRTHQKRGRAATQSHRSNPYEKRRHNRPVAASRCSAPTRSPNAELKKEEATLKRITTYVCDECGAPLEHEGQRCNRTTYNSRTWRSEPCTGVAVKDKEKWVAV